MTMTQKLMKLKRKLLIISMINILLLQSFAARLAQVNLVTKTDFDNKLSSLNRKITSNKTKHLIVENELKKLETFDSIYFPGKSHFEDDGTQNWLAFQPIQRYFKTVSANDNNILSWKSKGLSDESIKAPTTSNKILNPSQNYVGTKARIKFSGDCLKQEKILFNHGKIVNIYIVYEIERNVNISSYPTLENCLFGAVKLTKHVDVDLYKYSGYGIGFDRKGSYSIGNEIGRNVIILGVDMSSSPHIDNKKDILILGKDPTQKLEHTLTEEKLYSINFTKENTKFCLGLHYNRGNSYLFVNATELIKFKAKDSEITAYPLCLENISKDWSVDNKKKTGLKGYVMILVLIIMLLQFLVY